MREERSPRKLDSVLRKEDHPAGAWDVSWGSLLDIVAVGSDCGWKQMLWRCSCPVEKQIDESALV